MSTIKAGYRITVESWENDADNYRTLSIDGIKDKEYVAFLVDVMNLLRSGTNSDYTETFGNISNYGSARSSENIDKYKKALIALCDKHNAIKFFMEDDDTEEGFEAHEYVEEVISELHGNSEDFYNRVTDSVVVEYIPNDVVFEDVTKEF